MHESNKNDPNWKTPAALTSCPSLEPWEASYLNDFNMLSSSRQQGMGAGAIPVSEILKFAEHFGIKESYDFLYIMQAIDAVYLEKVYEKQEREREATKGKNAAKGGKGAVKGVNNRITKR